MRSSFKIVPAMTKGRLSILHCSTNQECDSKCQDTEEMKSSCGFPYKKCSVVFPHTDCRGPRKEDAQESLSRPLRCYEPTEVCDMTHSSIGSKSFAH